LITSESVETFGLSAFYWVVLPLSLFLLLRLTTSKLEIRDKQEAEKIESPKKAPVQLVGRVK
jgi:hypothetical protein